MPPLTPRQVQADLSRDLAYTTVITTLSRLHAKGLVVRSEAGRAFAHSPTHRADDMAAQTMSDLLGRATDAGEVLTRIVARLDMGERQLLRRLSGSCCAGCWGGLRSWRLDWGSLPPRSVLAGR